MTIGRKILMSVAVTVVFFVLLEGLLALVGVRAESFADDPYVGFSSHLPLFVETTGAGGVTELVTADNKLTLFNPQRFPAEKGMRFGSSVSVARRPSAGPMTMRPRSADGCASCCPSPIPTRKWEVVNAGGVSYASYRVALLMEELIEYEPDLFIVYSGHNEFLERRTYPQIIAMPQAVRGVGSVAARNPDLDRHVGAVQRFSGAPAAPESNPDILNEEVTTLLDSAVGPSAYTRDDELAEKILAHFRYNLARMVDIAASVGAETMLITPASNLRDSRPFKSEHRDGSRERGSAADR